MSVAVPPVIVTAFAINGEKNTIPVATQIPITPGAASFNDGFPPLTMTPIPSGGIPPAGKDMNGILFMLSAHIAWLQAGGQYQWAPEVAAAGGYGVGAVVQSAVTPSLYFQNADPDNVNDPDDDPTGWLPFSPVASTALATLTLDPGQTDDVNAAGVGFMDLTADATGSQVSGFAGGTDGQLMVVTNVSANPLTLLTMTGSAPGNQLRLPVDMTLLQNSGYTLRYSAALAVWVPA